MNTDTVRDLVHAACESPSNMFGSAFFDQHIITVVHFAGLLAKQLDADPQVVELAAYLHDLAAIRDIRCVPTHHLDGARVAHDILSANRWPAGVIDAVCRCIESHSAPVALGQGSVEAVCLSNADVMSHIAKPAYWLYYLYGVRGMSYEDGLTWLHTRAERLWGDLTHEAQTLVAAERATAVRILEHA